MKGYAASHRQGAEALVPEDEQLLFSQGIQVYLLQQWLAYFSLGAAVIHQPEVLKWFETISQKARSPDSDYALFAHHERKLALEGNSSETFAPPEGLNFNMIHEWVWNLLKIPFSSTLTNCSRESGERPSIAPVRGDSSLMNGVSKSLKDALAATLEKTSHELLESDLGLVIHLDLSHQELSANDCAMIGRLQNLERLDLNNSRVQALDGLERLHRLKTLNLTYTSVKDISALEGFTQLETLDLSFSGVEDLSPLKNLPAVTSLILYGLSILDFEPLRSLVALQRLNLSHTNVTDDDLEILEGLTHLTQLFLYQTKVGKARGAALKQIIGYNLEIGL